MRSLIVLVIGMVLFSCSQAQQGSQPELKVSWKLETNFLEPEGHRAVWTIENISGTELTSSNWALYWNMAPRDIHANTISAPVTMRWLGGDFYEMKPAKGFQLKEGEAVSISYEGSEAMIKETDAPLGVYLVFNGPSEKEQLIPIADYTIETFDSPTQINRNKRDLEPIPTAEWLYEQNKTITEIPEEQLIPLIPTPKFIKKGLSTINLTSSTKIHYQDGLANEAELLSLALSNLISGSIAVVKSDQTGAGIIAIQNSNNTVSEQYILDINQDGIIITGDPSGVFYGTQSLLALVPASFWRQETETITIPQVQMEDQPAFGYRGMHLDLARNFNSLETVKRLLDIMAFYKLNKLQLRLTEDEAWRLEIEELPELTEIGAFRGHTLNDDSFLHPSYGSGPHPDPNSGYGSGFFSRAEYVEMVRYARARHIEIIPEICVPSHARAAIKAMEFRYRRLIAEGKPEEAETYRLIDPNDESRYRSAQWYTDNIICVCKESAYTFFTTVIDDIIDMHEEAGAPLKTLHTGGDEVPRGAWTASPLCEEYMNEHPEVDNTRNLQRQYFRRIRSYLEEKNLIAAGWEEVAQNYDERGPWTPNPEFAATNVVPYIWNSLWGDEDLGNRLANAGYPVVLCNVTNFYFDLAYNKDPREPGLYWAGFVDTRDAFDFVPYDVFKSIKVSADGKTYNKADFIGMEKLTTEGRKNILGFQGQLWSETIKGQDMLEYYYLPKMMGLAERAWVGQADWANVEDENKRQIANNQAWNRFANLVSQNELPRLDHFNGGYNYRLASPGAIYINGKVVVNSVFPGMEIRYTTNGSDPTQYDSLYNGPFEPVSKQIKLSTVDSRGRASLPTTLNLN